MLRGREGDDPSKGTALHSKAATNTLDLAGKTTGFGHQTVAALGRGTPAVSSDCRVTEDSLA
jgi:hypothetical protein